MFRRILVPLDGSTRAEQVLPIVARLAHAAGGTIILLRVVDLTHEGIPYGMGMALVPPDTIESAMAEERSYLERLAQSMHLTSIAAVERQVVCGTPASKILDMVEKCHCDLIVMASHGYTGFRQWLMGSVAEHVAHYSNVPVLILRDEDPLVARQRPDGTKVVRALVPLDVAAHMEDAIVPAAQMVAALSSPGKGVLHLIQMLVIPEDVSETEKETILQEARATLDTIGQRVREDLRAVVEAEYLPKVTWSLSLDSDISEGIARVAERGEETIDALQIERCDLIAMTTYALNGLQKWVTGSVTDRVLHTTRLPMLIARPAETIEKEARQQTKPSQVRA